MDRERVARLDSTRMEQRVERFDLSSMGRLRTTPQGFIQVDARFTKVGVLRYTRADGTVRRELRLPEEVFDARSMASLKGAPVTDMHKGGMVNPDNVRELQVGRVGDDVRQDGDLFLAGTLTLQDREAIDGVRKGDRRELSAGYNCRLEWSSGNHDGEPYDCIQRGIEYNHVSIGPKDWGRAGTEVAIKLDGEQARLDGLVEHRDAGQLFLFIQQQLELLGIDDIQLARDAGIDEVRLFSIMQGFDTPTPGEVERIARRLGIDADRLQNLIPDATRRDEDDKEPPMKTKKIILHLDGVDFEVEVPDTHAEDLQRRFKAMSDKAGTETARADGAEKELAEVKGKLDAADKELAEVKSPEHIQGRIKARVALEARARKVLGDEEKLDAKSDGEVMQMTIEKAQPDFKVDGKSEEALTGLFEFVTQGEAKPAQRGDGGRGAARQAAHEDGKDERTDAAEARRKARERSRTAWETPLAVTKDERKSA